MRIVFDPKLRRPGCVILQAALGGTVPTEKLHQLFSPDSWILHPTPGLGCFDVTDEQLEQLSTMTKAVTSSASRCPGGTRQALRHNGR